ncbi:MAG TPA: multicopper oxidase domain-containing protein [Chloroflexia bacterium]
MNATVPQSSAFNQNTLVRTLLLAFGGVAFIQWLHSSVLSGLEHAQADNGTLAWLRDGALALPFVALAVLLSQRGGRDNRLGLAALYAAAMGGGALLHGLFPEDAHAAHDGAAISNTGLLQHVLVVMAIAGAYAYLVDLVLASLDRMSNGTLDRLPVPGRLARIALPAAMLVALAPALLFTGTGQVAAQTSFSDQVIHPKGSLNLFVRKLPDGSMAFVAPDFGNNGVRPTIEMTEGETLNIVVKNEVNADVSLHVHGVHYNQDSDGTRHSNSFVPPGGTRTYQWRAAPGTAGYWHYHDHVMGDDEGTGGILAGLYGGLIVRKPGEVRPARTFVIVGHDKTLNGRIYPDTPTPTARQGELVEFLVISHGNRVHTFHLHAHRWITPNRPGDPNPANPANAGSGHEDNHILAPGDSFGFMVIAGDGVGPGMWMYHCHFQDHASAMKGFFNVLPAAQAANVETSRTFPETGKTVSGRFFEYWQQNGGLAQQGYPISEPFQEKSDVDGKTYTVQYFERAVFEAHPELARPYDVLLTPLGSLRYKEKYPNGR